VDFLALVNISSWEQMEAEEQEPFTVLERRWVGGREILVLGAASGDG
jgi:hypothetical protein